MHATGILSGLRNSGGGKGKIISGNSVAGAKTAMLHNDGRVRTRAQAAVHASDGHAQSLIITGNLTVDLDAKTANVGASRLDL